MRLQYLGYAVTAHRAQGVTVDTAHVQVEPTTTRENFYVAMTRGRHSNRAYVILDRADEHAEPHPGKNSDATGRSVLFGVLKHVGAELSALHYRVVRATVRPAAPIGRWSNSHYPFKQVLWDLVALIEKAIEHHFAGAYEASIPIILAQIDGMSRDLTGQPFFSKGNADPYLDDQSQKAELPSAER